jgi:hypothetical protein
MRKEDTCRHVPGVFDGIKRERVTKTDQDKDIEKVRNVDWLIDKLNRIDKMSEEERKEILELLCAEADKTAEEHRRGEHFMDEIEKYANSLNEEEKKLFYGDLNERWNRVLREESKRLSKLWK